MSHVSDEESEGEIEVRSCSVSVDWKIEGFISRSWTVNDYIESPEFDFLCIPWRLTMYPNGKRKFPESIIIELSGNSYDTQDNTHHMQFRIGLRKKDGTEQCIRSGEGNIDNNIWVKSVEIISRPELVRRKEEFALENAITVFCVLDACINGTVEMTSQTKSEGGIDKLAQSLKNLFMSGEESDLTLNVRGREFRCHRGILAARSSVFAAMLRQDMREKNTGVVQVEDCEPDAFREFLAYLYSGSTNDFSRENVLDLYCIADKYDTDEIKSKCLDLLMSDLSVENICDVVTLCIRHDESELLKKAVTFFAKNAKKILITVKWQNFMKENLVGANVIYLKALDHYIIPE